MNIKNHLKKLLISDSINNIDDENEEVEWIDKDQSTEYESKPQPVVPCEYCENINCSNCCDNNKIDKPGFEINIINEEKEKKVRITLEFNVKLSDNKMELISIDVDINMNTYLKIADELIQD